MAAQVRVFATLGQAKAEGYDPTPMAPTLVWKMAPGGYYYMAVILPMKSRNADR